MINMRFTKYGIYWTLLIIPFGILTVVFGMIPSLNDHRPWSKKA